MMVQNHVTREELCELLQGTTETARIKLIGDHVYQCLECRQSLDAMAAQSAIWKKMPILLKEARTQDASPPLDAWVREDESTSLEWNEANALDQVLEAPRHPEMLGRIGKYEVEREVGRGGMGVVLKAFDAELNRPVAIKILSPHLASHGTARRRFAQEAIAAAGVLHPNVIAVYGVNNEGKTPFIVMPFIDGPSLQKMVEQSGPLSEIEVVRVAMQIASGLAAAHAQGLVHRDIKPANILTEGGVHRVLITDFGLARAEADASLTRTGWLMGTPNYMSPEQSKGQRADSRSDLFSLGSLLYFISTGRLPFRAETPLGVLHRIQNDQPTPVRQLNHQISQTLSDIIEMLLQKAPSDRFQTAAELHDLLQHHLAYLHQPDASKPPSVRRVKKLRFHAKRLPTTAAFGCLFLCCMALGFSGWGPSWNSPAVPNFFNGTFGSLFALQNNDDETKGQQGIQAFHGRSLYQEGMRLYEKKKYPEAMEKFEQATQDPRYRAKSHYNIACILALLEKNSEAIDALNKAVEYGYVDARQYRTDRDLQSLREEAGFKTLMDRLTQFAEAEKMAEQGRRESEEGRYQEAEKHYRAALEICPNHEFAITNLGYVLHLQGRIDEALPWHERASQSASFHVLGTYNLACYYAMKKDKEKALRLLERAVELGLASILPVTHLEEDRDLDNIRNEDGFKPILEKLRKHERWVAVGLDPLTAEEYQAKRLDPIEHKTFVRKGVPPGLVQRYADEGLTEKEYTDALLHEVEPNEAKDWVARRKATSQEDRTPPCLDSLPED